MDKKWNILSSETLLVKKLSEELNVSEIIARLLVIRGITTYKEAEEFFRPKISDLHNPFLMKGMEKAVDRMHLAILNNERILIYGDYDVDGTTSVAMMYDFLQKRTKNIEYYIPCRNNEGYGLSIKAINFAKQQKISLVITLDCGIGAIKQIEYANQIGLDIIICDHHKPKEEIPKAIAILNPKQKDCLYPYKELSGCGVGFKFIQAFSLFMKEPFSSIKEYLDLLVVSIAADIVDVTGENRILAFYGLKQINFAPRVGLKLLIKYLGKKSDINMTDILFGIAPRINAAGRINHANKAVEILKTKDILQANQIANEIEEHNKFRKEIEKKITNEALEMIDVNKKSTVVFNKNWHKGVIGIVASRLIENHYKPTIVLAEKDGFFIGSGRSVRGFDLYEAISKCSYLCENFGGHKYAAGVTIRKKNLIKFAVEFEKTVSSKIKKEQLIPKIDIDMQIEIQDINDKLFRIIKQFEPFGPKNPKPVFSAENNIDNGYAKKIGKDKEHLKINIKTKSNTIGGIGFGLGNRFDHLIKGKAFDVCFSLAENQWNGEKKIQLILKDIRERRKS